MQKKLTYDITSLNVRGIREQTKRRSIFSYLKDQKSKFYFLQETYSDLNDENIWRNEWGGEIFFSHGTRHSKGVCILIHPSVRDKVEFIFTDKLGRIVLITIVINSLKVSLCNIYAPNNQSEQLDFLQELNNCLIDKSELTTLIVGGDWNCTLSKSDKRGGKPWRATNYRNLVLTTMDILDLIDIQREKHPKLRKYSYESKALKVKSRIDFFLVAKHLEQYVKKSEIYSSVAPDHKAIYISLSWSNPTPRGPGLWKFNNSLLNDEEYVNKIRETYAHTCVYYSDSVNKRLFWEMLKMEIRAATISFSKDIAKSTYRREMEIRRQLDVLDDIICNNFHFSEIDLVLKEFDNLKTELQSIYDKKGMAAIFRSKCRWIEMGERPTKYFFNLEKRNYIKKTITELRMEDETTIKDETQILDAIENYFNNLYMSTDGTTQDDYDQYIQDLSLPRLSDEERDNMEGLLTYEECKKVLETFQNDKSPGEDGFTVEFYKFFFELLGHDLIASFNEAYEANELTISQRRGVITLIPKEDGSLMDLSNWRPITLLNVDCKIATKAIAKRVEASLPKLINHDQTGFIKGRYIGENIRLIIDAMEYTKAHNIPGILVSLDFRKAFDSLEWPFIMRTLDTFNFGKSIKKWVSTFYTNIESAVLNNGFLTKWFRPSRGVRQGCPLSPYLFILSAEIMANKVRQEPGFKGIKILGNELKLSQYADDTNLFCADLASVEKILEIVENFGNMAGLKLNRRKTKAIWLGRWEKNKSNPLQLKWLHSPVKILGIYVSYDENGNKQMNFNLKLQKLQTNLDMWRARDLTLFGRVLIIKSLGLSQLVYSASNLTVPQEITPIIKTKLFNFLWKNKRDKIKRAGLYQEREKGGISMTDVETMIKALRLAWIPRLLTPEIRNWKTIPDYYLRKLGGLNFLLRCNYDVKYIDGLPLFYQNILTFFNELKNLYSCEGIQDMVLFNNKEILVGGKPVFIKEWFDCNILFIQDLLNSKGQLLSFREFINKYDCSTNFLQFYQVTSAIPKYLVTKARNTEPPQNGLYTRNNFLFQLDASTQIQLEKAKTRDFYCLLNRKTHTVSQTGPMKWNSIIGLDENAWKIIFTSPKNVCKEPKLKEFQFKLIHRIVVTKKELHRYGIKADDECLYCGEKDSIDHTFLNCQFVKIFVNNVIDWFNAANNSKFAPTIGEKLFGIISGPYEKEIVKKFNYTLLFMKYYIYTSKMHNQAIHLSVFVNKVLFKYRIENFDD